MKLVLLDSLSLINRAFYALPMTLTDSNGRIINAAYGYTSMLSRIIREIKPTHLAAVFDLAAPTFRHIEYEKYKATRKPMPNELVEQIPIIKELLCKMGIPCMELSGYEADDVIGTIAKKYDIETVIVTGDKDCLQLIDDSTYVWLTKGNMKEIVFYDADKLMEVYALAPYQIIELKALMGDSSDNIPGVYGIGEVTALKLIREYNDVDNLYNNIDCITGKVKEKLISGRESAYLSKALATIDINVPISIDIDKLLLKYPFTSEAYEFFISMRFNSLLDKFQFDNNHDNECQWESTEVIIKESDELAQIVEKCVQAETIAFNINMSNLYIAYQLNECYRLDFEEGFLSALSYNNVVDIIKPLFKNSNKIVTYSNKNLLHFLNDNGIASNCSVFDLSIACYVIDSAINNESISDIIKSAGLKDEHIGAKMLMLYDRYSAELTKMGLDKLYYDLELPLSEVLYDMERTGFRVDGEFLASLNAQYTARLKELTDTIYLMAGEEFNINSTKQLSEILFNKLKLPIIKKTKTGLSSDAEVLNELKDKHPIIPNIQVFRQLAKLNSTYCVGLLKLIEKDGKIRTVFKQTLTQTGRISSQEPNLQNIPIREDEGRELRRAFIASEGNTLVCADYSQIELRLLAHMSQDIALIKAFNDNQDIHSYTASLVFNVPQEEVDSHMRRYAKAVNFGIIYGISDYGLSNNINIPVHKARDFINRYFDTYKQVKSFMESNVKYAKDNGYIRTLLGRIRYIREIKSANYNIRSFGERVAMNMPLQGSAADIIKVAMLNTYNRLNKEGLRAKMILQVHDELIIDCPMHEQDIVKNLLKEEMEKAYKLNVALTVNISTGINWLEAK